MIKKQRGNAEQDSSDEELDVGPFFDYLKSSRGHEIVSRIITIVEDLKKAHLEKTTSHAKFEKWLQAGIVVVVIVATTFLTYIGKFDASIGVLFGTMVGYLFGKHQSI